VITPCALIGDSLFLLEKTRTVGAGLDTIPATDAIIVVDKHNTVLRPEGGAHRADLDTGGMGAVVTNLGHKKGFADLGVFVAVVEPVFRFGT
jgi:hypothetical protein